MHRISELPEVGFVIKSQNLTDLYLAEAVSSTGDQISVLRVPSELAPATHELVIPNQERIQRVLLGSGDPGKSTVIENPRSHDTSRSNAEYVIVDRKWLNSNIVDDGRSEVMPPLGRYQFICRRLTPSGTWNESGEILVFDVTEHFSLMSEIEFRITKRLLS